MSIPLPDCLSSRHVVWLTFPAFSHLKATLAMAEELLRRGHRVSYLVADRLADTVADTGARVVPYRSVFPTSIGPQLDPTAMLVAFLRESFAPLEAALACVADDPPDLVVHDALASDVAVALGRRYGIPTVRTYAGFGTNDQVPLNGTEPDPGQPPVDPADPRLAELVAELTDRVAAVGVADLFGGGPADGDGAALNISFVTREFQIGGDSFGDDYLFAGPCLRPADFAGTWSPPAGDAPVLLISLGTTANQRPDFFRLCAETFAGTPWHVVMTLGRGMDPAALGPLPPNVEAHRWVPHLAVLEHATAFVCQGGTGSLMEAFYHDVPVVVVPQQADQHAIARQVVDVGAGRLLLPAELEPATLRRTVEAAVADHAARREPGVLRRSVRDAPGAVGVADRIEELLVGGGHPAD